MGNIIGYSELTRNVVNFTIYGAFLLLSFAVHQAYSVLWDITYLGINFARFIEINLLVPFHLTWTEVVFLSFWSYAALALVHLLSTYAKASFIICATFYRATVIWWNCKSVEVVYPVDDSLDYKLDKLANVLKKNEFADKPAAPAKDNSSAAPVDRPEGAFGSDYVYDTPGGIPRGCFCVYGAIDNDDGTTPAEVRYALLGHGFLINNDGYCTAHELHRFRDIRVGVPGNNRLLQVSFEVQSQNHFGTKFDFAIARNCGIGSVFGIKGLSWGLYNQNANVQIYHRNANGKYTEQYVRADPYEQQSDRDPSLIFTKSNTTGGDSGLCVVQKGKVVAVHLGGSTKFRRNVAQIPLFLSDVAKLYEGKGNAFKPVLPNLEIESPTQQDAEDQRAREFVERRERDEQEAKDARMRREHEDEQGFRGTFSEMISATSKRRGKTWIDIEDDDFVAESDEPMPKLVKDKGVKRKKPETEEEKLDKEIAALLEKRKKLGTKVDVVDKEESSSDAIPPELQSDQVNSRSPAVRALEVPPQSRQGITLESLLMELRDLKQLVQELENRQNETKPSKSSSGPSTKGEPKKQSAKQENSTESTEKKSTNSGNSETPREEEKLSEAGSSSTWKEQRKRGSRGGKKSDPPTKSDSSTEKQ